MTPLGARLLQAFLDVYKTQDKKKMAEILGYESDKAIYKIVNGEQEMRFSALLGFREHTGYSIDWLLTGEGPMRAADAPATFNIERSIEEHDDNWYDVIEDWYAFEKRQMPEMGSTDGFRLFGGWAAKSLEEKVETIRLVKRRLDEALET